LAAFFDFETSLRLFLDFILSTRNRTAFLESSVDAELGQDYTKKDQPSSYDQDHNHNVSQVHLFVPIALKHQGLKKETPSPHHYQVKILRPYPQI
jgi:hypothetical protein